LGGSDAQEAYALTGIDPSRPHIEQGYALLRECVSSLTMIADAIEAYSPSAEKQSP
jgi:hypothetical protein